jgi:hypothetical protein
MFKSKEELIKENQPFPSISALKHISEEQLSAINSENNGIIEGIEIAFKSIAERKEFYRKFKDNMITFKDEYESDYSLFFDYVLKVECVKILYEDALDILNKYWDDWLFHFCFDGVK